MFPICHIREKGDRSNKRDRHCEKNDPSARITMGCGENKLMAQQVQETVHKV